RHRDLHSFPTRRSSDLVTLVPTREALYFCSDTPFETNHIYRYSRQGILSQVAELNGSSIYGCRAREAIFFSTMVEPSAVNRDRQDRKSTRLNSSHVAIS